MPRKSSIELIAVLDEFMLLSEHQMRELREKIASQFPNPSGLGEELLRRGWLTAFQLERIERGEGQALVLGAYRILEPIGGGGMGRVFKAKHTLMERVVAIKEVHPGLLDHPDAARRFRQEIVAAAKLYHPNVIAAHDAQETDGRFFLVMEHCDGFDLARAVAEAGPLPVSLACDYIRQAALGLQHVHEHGLVHRDIKPQNLLLAGTTVKILDLGLARLPQKGYSGSSYGSLTGDGVLLGTPDYVAPEQATDARVADIRSDIYSLGCTFFFLLADQVPFPGGALLEKLLRHQFEPPTALARLRPEIPTAVLAIIDKMMAKSPDDRYQTPSEVAEALSPYSQTADAHVPRNSKQPLADESMSWLPPAPKSAQSKVIPSPSNVPSNRRISRRAVLALAGIGVGAAAIPAAIHFWPSKTLPPVDPSKSSTDRWRAWRTFEYQPEFSDLNRRDGIFAVAMSPDGRQAAVGFGDLVRPHVNPGFVRLLDLQSGHWREIGRLKSAVSRIAFVGDGQTVVATSGVLTHGVEVSGFGDVLVRDLAKYEARTISLELERLNCLAVDSYGKWAIVAGTLGRLRRIALDDGRVLSSFDEPFKTNITALAVAADGSRVAVGYRTGAVDIREADDLRRRSIEFPVSKEQLAAMTGLGFRYDCKELVGTTRKLEGDRSQIRIWNLANSKPISVIAESESDIRAMDLAADGQSLATGTQDGMLRIWNMTEQRIVFEERAHNEPVFALSFAADGLTLASCSTDATVRLWVRE